MKGLTCWWLVMPDGNERSFYVPIGTPAPNVGERITMDITYADSIERAIILKGDPNSSVSKWDKGYLVRERRFDLTLRIDEEKGSHSEGFSRLVLWLEIP